MKETNNKDVTVGALRWLRLSRPVLPLKPGRRRPAFSGENGRRGVGRRKKNLHHIQYPLHLSIGAKKNSSPANAGSKK